MAAQRSVVGNVLYFQIGSGWASKTSRRRFVKSMVCGPHQVPTPQ